MYKSILALAVCATSQLCGFAAAPVDSLIYRTPYLQNICPTGVTIMYQSPVSVTSWVEYTTDTVAGERLRERQLYAGQEVVHDAEHKVRLENLKPGQRYYYRVGAREITVNKAYHKEFGDSTYVSPFHSFTTPTDNTTDFTAIILNDLHCYKPTVDSMAVLAASIPHDFIVFNGDCLPEPSDRMDALQAIHDLADAYNLASVPSFIIRGNHEIRNAYSSGMPTLFDYPGGLTYGAFNWGDTRFVTLDCGEDKPDSTWVYYGLNDFDRLHQEQADFLKAEIASEPFKNANRHVLIHHIPLWGNTDKYQPCNELWMPIIAEAPFDINLAAHTHRYRLHQKGELGNPFPVMVGGGPRHTSARMAVLTKRGNDMRLKVLDIDGNVVDELTL